MTASSYFIVMNNIEYNFKIIRHEKLNIFHLLLCQEKQAAQKWQSTIVYKDNH